MIAGGHGKIARELIRTLTAGGDRAVALIRNPDHETEVTALGAYPVLVDLEKASVDEVATLLEGADAAVFAAGAGPGSGIERKDTVDRGASVLLAAASEKAGVRRFVQISSFGAGEPIPDGTDDVFAAYLVAKTEAEEDLRARTYLDWTIVRPGKLTDDDPTGFVDLTPPPHEYGEVSRADVAHVIAAVLAAENTFGATLMLTSGHTELTRAVEAI
nr:NAD(P)H-binding protein [Rhodococcus rhodnii]